MKNSYSYAVHPAAAHCQTIIKNLKKKTGHSLEAWLNIIQQCKLLTEKEQVEWLKEEFKLGSMTIDILISEIWQKH